VSRVDRQVGINRRGLLNLRDNSFGRGIEDLHRLAAAVLTCCETSRRCAERVTRIHPELVEPLRRREPERDV
jgi:hypothetical protein